MKECKEFLTKYKKYVIGVAALILVVIIAVAAFGNGGSKNSKEFAENENKDLEKLITNYYDAYAKGDTKKITAYAAPVSDNEKSYIKLFAKYVEKYNIKKIYTKQGVDENEMLVSVEMDVKFKDVKTEAPGLDFFYVTGVNNGEMYIVNLYSQFNSQTKEYKTEDNIEECIREFESLDEVEKLQSKVQDSYDEAVKSDENLDKMINTTIEKAVTDWMSSIKLEQNQTPPEAALTEEDSKDEEKTKDTDEKDESKEDSEKEDTEDTKEEDSKEVEVKKVSVKEYVVTKEAEVNLRKGPSINKESMARLEKGAKMQVICMNTWGEWTYVKTRSGKKGYIKNNFLKTLDNDYTMTGEDGYPEKQKKYKLSSETNLMTSMKSKARVISALTKGTKVKVITCYINGYSKVSSNGRVGYILTENLKLD
ncbi:MAG: hypothetical protein K6A30_06080 [Lachnospiraceae bacterium]|nr:hypothetical protein [Lachnospiraceae bacterium]